MLVRVIPVNFRALPHICLINACMRKQILLRSTPLKNDKCSPYATDHNGSMRARACYKNINNVGLNIADRRGIFEHNKFCHIAKTKINC